MGLVSRWRGLTRAINVGIISVFKTIEKNEITQDMSVDGEEVKPKDCVPL